MNIWGALKPLSRRNRKKLALAYSFLTEDENLIEAVDTGDRQGVADILDARGDFLEEEFAITQMQVINPDITSFFRYHNPTEYGDDLTQRELLLEVREQEEMISAFDEGVFGYACGQPVLYMTKKGNYSGLWK